MTQRKFYKVLTDKDCADIIRRAIYDSDLIDCTDQYEYFLSDLANLITEHFGGQCSLVDVGPDGNWYVCINENECIPEDGGVYNQYDSDGVK